jgi:hypothetical protein
VNRSSTVDDERRAFGPPLVPLAVVAVVALAAGGWLLSSRWAQTPPRVVQVPVADVQFLEARPAGLANQIASWYRGTVVLQWSDGNSTITHYTVNQPHDRRDPPDSIPGRTDFGRCP